MKIFGWNADDQGCGYYRIIMPWSHLSERGHAALWGQRIRGSIMDETYDAIVGQRVCQDQTTQIWCDMAKRKRAKLVYEIDDDIFAIDSSSQIAYEYFHLNPNRLDNMKRCMEVADLVTVSTEPLAKVCRNFNANVKVLPNCIDAKLLGTERMRRENLTVGWGGSATHRMDLEEVANTLSQFFRRNPEIDMHFLGNDFRGILHKSLLKDDLVPAGKNAFGRSLYEPRRFRFTDWKPMPEMYRHIDFDIGLAPLRAHIFNQSKSYLKALEYNALGIPVVASDTEPYRGYIQHGVNGYLAKTPVEFGKYLRQLATEKDLREEMGANGRKIAAGYAIQDRVEDWERAYAELLDD